MIDCCFSLLFEYLGCVCWLWLFWVVLFWVVDGCIWFGLGFVGLLLCLFELLWFCGLGLNLGFDCFVSCLFCVCFRLGFVLEFYIGGLVWCGVLCYCGLSD